MRLSALRIQGSGYQKNRGLIMRAAYIRVASTLSPKLLGYQMVFGIRVSGYQRIRA